MSVYIVQTSETPIQVMDMISMSRKISEDVHLIVENESHVKIEGRLVTLDGEFCKRFVGLSGRELAFELLYKIPELWCIDYAD